MKAQLVSSTAERIEALTLCSVLLSGFGLEKHRAAVAGMIAEMKDAGFEAGQSPAGEESMKYGQGPGSCSDMKTEGMEKIKERPAPRKLTYIPPAL